MLKEEFHILLLADQRLTYNNLTLRRTDANIARYRGIRTAQVGRSRYDCPLYGEAAAAADNLSTVTAVLTERAQEVFCKRA